jgi:hypothetical protein
LVHPSIFIVIEERSYFAENIYAEPTEPNRAYMCIKEAEEDSKFPAKHGRDINKEWACSYHKQKMPLPPKPDEEHYLDRNESVHAASNLEYPPCYQDVLDSIREAESPATRVYLTPLSDEEAARLHERNVNAFTNNDYLCPNGVPKP